jgi:hypothetical protein
MPSRLFYKISIRSRPSGTVPDTFFSPLKYFLPADLRSPARLFAPGLGDVKAGMLEEDARYVAVGLLSPQLTAFFTSAPILASSAAVNSFSAKAVGHMAPSSRFASCMKPNVAYLVLREEKSTQLD